ncbi:hypothetical protein QFC19_004781 [Naganishia cerealis]|uniref:Uncharacterized protein n=1 Tax=Naganishia cerealis TaxID=610337 RepID=A0ACC2VTL0_9TREE|nr:hypothetical protein QFC19_004781 [Naganishia cerealis]
MHHLLDILLAHTRPPRERRQSSPSEARPSNAAAAPTKRDRQRSADAGRGWLGGLTLPRRGGGSSNALGTWFGFTSPSAAAAPSSNAHDLRPRSPTAGRTEPEVVAAADVESLEEALAAAERDRVQQISAGENDVRQTPTDDPVPPLEWTLEPVWIPVRTFVDDDDDDDDTAAGEGEHEFPETEGNEIAQYYLAYTVHETALVGLVLDATIPLDRIDAILNKDTTASGTETGAYEPVDRLELPVRDLFTTLARQTNHPPTFDASSSPAVRPSSLSQWVYVNRSNKGVYMESNWDAERVIFPSPHDRAVGPSTASKPAGNNKGKSLVSVDEAGVAGKKSLMQIDHAKEMFARMVNDVWLVGKRCPSTGTSSTAASTRRTVKDEEAYLVLTAKETSIVDAECE